jgi:hypothetical protein
MMPAVAFAYASGVVILPLHVGPVSARVAISAGDIDLSRLAALLDKQCEVDVLVAEVRDQEKVSVCLRDSTVADHRLQAQPRSTCPTR